MNDLHTLGKAMRDAQRRVPRNPRAMPEDVAAMRAAEAAFDKALAAPPADNAALIEDKLSQIRSDLHLLMLDEKNYDRFHNIKRQRDAVHEVIVALAAPPADNAALIAEARDYTERYSEPSIVHRLADALEAAIARAEKAEARASELWAERQQILEDAGADQFDLIKRVETATRQRDEAREALREARRWAAGIYGREKLFAIIDAALSGESAAKESEGWLPIESAPKDGIEFIAWDGKYAFRCKSQKHYVKWPHEEGGPTYRDEWASIYYDSISPEHPTHWRPLPAPPKEPAP